MGQEVAGTKTFNHACHSGKMRKTQFRGCKGVYVALIIGLVAFPNFILAQPLYSTNRDENR